MDKTEQIRLAISTLRTDHAALTKKLRHMAQEMESFNTSLSLHLLALTNLAPHLAGGPT